MCFAELYSRAHSARKHAAGGAYTTNTREREGARTQGRRAGRGRGADARGGLSGAAHACPQTQARWVGARPGHTRALRRRDVLWRGGGQRGLEAKHEGELAPSVRGWGPVRPGAARPGKRHPGRVRTEQAPRGRAAEGARYNKNDRLRPARRSALGLSKSFGARRKVIPVRHTAKSEEMFVRRRVMRAGRVCKLWEGMLGSRACSSGVYGLRPLPRGPRPRARRAARLVAAPQNAARGARRVLHVRAPSAGGGRHPAVGEAARGRGPRQY